MRRRFVAFGFVIAFVCCNYTAVGFNIVFFLVVVQFLALISRLFAMRMRLLSLYFVTYDFLKLILRSKI